MALQRSADSSTWPMPWGSVRTEGMFQDWSCHVHQHTDINFEAVQSESEDKPPVVTIRDVKKNLFPPFHLRLKLCTRPLVKTRGGKACGQSLIELTSKQLQLVKRFAAFPTRQRGIRRPRYQRRKDWELVISYLGADKLRSAVKLQPCVNLGDLNRPVLPSRMIKLDISCDFPEVHIPVKPRLRPSKCITVATVCSNLWFDTELLAGEVSNRRAPSAAEHESSVAMSKALDHFHFQSISNSPSLFQGAQRMMCGGDRNVVVKMTPLERLNRVSGGGRSGIDAIIKNDSLLKGYNWMPERLPSRSVESKAAVVHTFLKARQTSPDLSSSRIRTQGCFAIPEDEAALTIEQGMLERLKCYYTEACANRISIGIPVPITHLLVPPARSSEDVRKACCAKPVQYSHGAKSLDAILSFKSKRYSFETGLWCTGSAEIARNSFKAPQRVLLSSVPMLLFLRDNKELAVAVKGGAGIHKPQKVESVQEVFRCMKGLIAQKPLLGKQWKRFEGTIRSDIAEEENQESDERARRIQDSIYTYDPPRRRRSKIASQTIRSRYEVVLQSSADDNPRQGEDKNNLESDESVLGDLLLLNEDLGDLGDNDACLEQLGSLIKTQCPAGPDHANNEGQLNSPSQPNSRGVSRLGRELLHKSKERVSALQAPENLACTPWGLQLADVCLHMNRGTLFLPPPLSALPIIAALAHSHLCGSHADHRVLAICGPGTDLVVNVYSHFMFCFGQRISIDMVRRENFPRTPALMSLHKIMGRIVLVDSFDFDPSDGFSLLLLIGTDASASDGRNPGKPPTTGALHHIKKFANIPSVVAVSHHPHSNLRGYCEVNRTLSSIFGTEEVILVEARDDVYNLIMLSRPDVLVLVPPREVIDLLALLETCASSLFPCYNSLQAKKPQAHRAAGALSEVSLSKLADFLENPQLAVGQDTMIKIGVLYCLRQARSYALCSGVNSAADYLKHFAHTSATPVLNMLQSVVHDAEALKTSDGNPESIMHPMAKAITKSMKETKKQMVLHPPSLKAIHRRTEFSPLIIAGSTEVYNGLLHAMPNAQSLSDARPGETAVCELKSLFNERGRKRAQDTLLKNVERFSHVYHILEDRDQQSAEGMLPPEILEYVHVGRTRLITVLVDESRELEYKWRRNEQLFDELSRRIVHSAARNDDGHPRFITRTSMEKVISTFNTLVSPSEQISVSIPEMENQSAEPVRTLVRGNGASCQPHKVVMGISEAYRLSVETIRAKLRSKIESLGSTTDNIELVIRIGMHEAFSIGTSNALLAIAGDSFLFSKVRLRTEFF